MPAAAKGRSSTGRAAVSKTAGCRFKSCRPCSMTQVAGAVVDGRLRRRPRTSFTKHSSFAQRQPPQRQQPQRQPPQPPDGDNSQIRQHRNSWEVGSAGFDQASRSGKSISEDEERVSNERDAASGDGLEPVDPSAAADAAGSSPAAGAASESSAGDDKARTAPAGDGPVLPDASDPDSADSTDSSEKAQIVATQPTGVRRLAPNLLPPPGARPRANQKPSPRAR